MREKDGDAYDIVYLFLITPQIAYTLIYVKYRCVYRLLLYYFSFL